VDTVTVTTSATEPVQIVRFQVSPDRIRVGQSSNLDWQVLNADTVTITEIGAVPANGTRAVSPRVTTTYRLTATNRNGSVTATATVVVEEEPMAAFTACSVSPMNIIAGESATILFATSNAESVEISGGVGPVPTSGTRVVTPTQTTTYTLTARNARGPVTCNVTVQVTQGTAPRVISFTANPTSITAGNSSTLSWNVENADTVTITNLGTVNASGSRSVSPTATTTYTLTATNRNGTVTATTTITVTPGTGGPGDPGPGPGPGPAPTITACTASPSTSAAPGNPVTINFTAANASRVVFSPAVSGTIGTSGPVTVSPTATTTYTLTAQGTENRTAVCTVTVTVTPAPPPPTAVISGGAVIETFIREVVLSGEESVNPTGGALTYIWTPLYSGAAVLDQGQPRTRVQLGGLAGDYPFQLTVRNPAGAESTAVVTVRFRGDDLR